MELLEEAAAVVVAVEESLVVPEPKLLWNLYVMFICCLTNDVGRAASIHGLERITD